MSCLPTPQSLDDVLAAIDRCATQYGGAGWQSTALTGLVTAALVGLVVVLLAMGLRELHRG